MVAAVAPCAIFGGRRMKKKARKSDVMLTGGDARRVMGSMTRDVMVAEFQATMDEGEDSMEQMIEIGNNHRLRYMTAARWHWDQETDAEAQMAELVDARRHGAYRANRIHKDEVLRLDLNGTLDAFARQLTEIHGKQLIRDAANTNSYRKLEELERLEELARKQQAEVESATVEIVHPPTIEGSVADYDAAQDALGVEFAHNNPAWYLMMNGDEKGAVISIADVQRLQRNDPKFDDRMHVAMPHVAQIINNHPSNPARGRGSFQEVSPPSDHPHVRDSERPAGDV